MCLQRRPNTGCLKYCCSCGFGGWQKLPVSLLSELSPSAPYWIFTFALGRNRMQKKRKSLLICAKFVGPCFCLGVKLDSEKKSMLTRSVCTALDNIEGNMKRQAQLQAESPVTFCPTTKAAQLSDYCESSVRIHPKVQNLQTDAHVTSRLWSRSPARITSVWSAASERRLLFGMHLFNVHPCDFHLCQY